VIGTEPVETDPGILDHLRTACVASLAARDPVARWTTGFALVWQLTGVDDAFAALLALRKSLPCLPKSLQRFPVVSLKWKADRLRLHERHERLGLLAVLEGLQVERTLGLRIQKDRTIHPNHVAVENPDAHSILSFHFTRR